MRKDINMPAVTDIKVAVAKTIDHKGESDWYVYLINNKPADLNNVMIVSSAHEEADGSGRQTSKLRHFVEELKARTFAKVERIDPAVFGFYNNFWVSFYIGRELFDKKFQLPPFAEWDLERIDELEMEGVVTE